MAEKPKPGDELSNAARQMQAAQPYLNAVWKLVGGAVVGVVGGLLLQRWTGWGVWVMPVFAAIGISVGFYGFLRAVLSMGKH